MSDGEDKLFFFGLFEASFSQEKERITGMTANSSQMQDPASMKFDSIIF